MPISTQPERQCGQIGLHKVTGTLQQKFKYKTAETWQELDALKPESNLHCE